MKRKDGAAPTRTVLPDGTIEWRNKAGRFHREGGPAWEQPSIGAKAWYRNGKFHREDGGPSIENAKAKYWHRNGKLHREDGPAIETADGMKYWYRNGEQLTEEEFSELRKKELEEQGIEISEAIRKGTTREISALKRIKLKSSDRRRSGSLRRAKS